MRIGVSGALGRMGQEVCRAVGGADDLELVASIDQDDELDQLTDVGVEVVVDFTTPDVVGANVDWYLQHGIHAVVGTTGWTADDLERWRRLADDGGANLVVAPNFALGAVLMMHLATVVAPHLPDVEITELHHDRKADAPSGTALRTAELVAEARADAPEATMGETVEGARGAECDGIRVHSVRLPGLVAHQEVIFGAPGQTLTIRHDTVDRSSFMPGVLLAVREVAGRAGVTVGLEHLLGLGRPGGDPAT